jgi:hypothetical protein
LPQRSKSQIVASAFTVLRISNQQVAASIVAGCSPGHGRVTREATTGVRYGYPRVPETFQIFYV